MHRVTTPLRRLAFLAAFLSLAVGRPASADPAPQDDSRGVATISLVPAVTAARPGQWVPVAVVIDLKPHWHIHTNDPKVPPALGTADDYIKTSLSAAPTADGRLRPDLGRIQWPAPVMVKVGFGGPPVDYGVFEGRTVVFVPVEVPANASAGNATLPISLSFQACDDKICLPPAEGVSQSVTIAVDPNAVGWPDGAANADLFKSFDRSQLPSAAPTPAPSSDAPRSGGSSTMMISIIAAVAALVALAIGIVVIKKVT